MLFVLHTNVSLGNDVNLFMIQYKEENYIYPIILFCLIKVIETILFILFIKSCCDMKLC